MTGVKLFTKKLVIIDRGQNASEFRKATLLRKGQEIEFWIAHQI